MIVNTACNKPYPHAYEDAGRDGIKNKAKSQPDKHTTDKESAVIDECVSFFSFHSFMIVNLSQM